MPTLRIRSLFWGGGRSLRQSARSALYNQAIPPLSSAHLHAQEEQGSGGGLLVGQGEWSQVALGNLVCRILRKFHDLLISHLCVSDVGHWPSDLHSWSPPWALPSRIKTVLFTLGLRYPRTPPKTQATRQVAGAPLLKSATVSKLSLIITNCS